MVFTMPCQARMRSRFVIAIAILISILSNINANEAPLERQQSDIEGHRLAVRESLVRHVMHYVRTDHYRQIEQEIVLAERAGKFEYAKSRRQHSLILHEPSYFVNEARAGLVWHEWLVSIDSDIREEFWESFSLWRGRADALSQKGQYRESAYFYEQCAGLFDRLGAPPYLLLVSVHVKRAEALLNCHRYRDAWHAAQSALSTIRQVQGDASPEVARLWDFVALTAFEAGQLEESIRANCHALHCWMDCQHCMCEDYVKSHIKAGFYFSILDETNERAKVALKSAERVAELAAGWWDLEPHDQLRICELLLRLGKAIDVKDIDRLLRHVRAVRSEERTDRILTETLAARMYLLLGEITKAQEANSYASRAVIKGAISDDVHRASILLIMKTHAEILRVERNFEEAVKVSRNALDEFEREYGTNHPSLRLFLDVHARALRDLDRDKEAVAFETRSEVIKKQLDEVRRRVANDPKCQVVIPDFLADTTE